MGTSRLIPKTFALSAVQRQTAASRSANPSMRVQHGVFGGVPIVIPTNPPSKSPHTPSFRASIEQLALPGLTWGGGQYGFGFGFGFGFGLGVGQVSHAVERLKNTRFSTRKMAIMEIVCLEAIFSSNVTRPELKEGFLGCNNFVVEVGFYRGGNI